MAQKKAECKICTNKAQVAGLCRACYQAAYYWSKKTPKQMVQRLNNLERYERRMEFMLGGNVHQHKKKRRAG